MKFRMLLAALVVAYFAYLQFGTNSQPHPSITETRTSAETTKATSAKPHENSSGNQRALLDAIVQHSRHVEIEVEARVLKLLPDDLQGSRHQKFLIQLETGETVLIAHNIDLANRVKNIQAGDTVQLKGEFIWNDKGGVLHWTHRDPNGHHTDGWIKHRGNTYH